MTAPAPTFDPAAFKRAAREQWQHHAEAWDRWAPALDSWLRPVTETIIELAHVREGHAVLDVAAGAFIRTAMHVANTHERTLEDQRVLEHATVTRSGRA